jgi:hypothetical protein
MFIQVTFVLGDQVKLNRQGMSGGYHRGQAPAQIVLYSRRGPGLGILLSPITS